MENQNPPQPLNLDKIEHDVATMNKHRIVSFALFEAAMRYVESYYRQDIEDYEEMLFVDMANYKGKKDKGWERRVTKRIEGMVVDFRNNHERFNMEVYAHIKKLTDALTSKSNMGFDNYSTSFGLLAEELIAAKNTTELLTIAKWYNMGMFDDALKTAKEQLIPKASEQEEVIVDGDHLNLGKNNVGTPIDIAQPKSSLEVIRGDVPDSQKSEC